MNIEPLEARIAPATLVNPTTLTYTDIDGDKVTVRTSAGTFVFTGPNGTPFTDTFVFTAANAMGGQQLDFIDLRQGSGFQGADLTVSVIRAGGGDGLAAVGLIFAPAIDLGKVTVKGDLGEIDCGDDDTSTPGLEHLSVRSMGRYGDATDSLSPGVVSTIKGALGALRVAEDIKDASIEVLSDVLGDGWIGSITIGGSLIGGAATASAEISAFGDIGAVKIGGDILGGAGQISARISSEGGIGSLTVAGSLIGGAGNSSGQISCNGDLGPVKIGGNVLGGTGIASGSIRTSATAGDGDIASLSVGGSLLGGAGNTSGGISSRGGIGPVKIARDVKGGAGIESGAIEADGTIASVSVAGSLLGGAGNGSGQVRAAGAIGAVRISGNLVGGTGEGTAHIHGAEIASAKIGGSVLGGDGNESGMLTATGDMGLVKIGHNLVGGTGERSGIVNAGGALAGISLGGSLVGNSGLGGSGQILSGDRMGAVVVKGDVLGGTGAESAFIRSAAALSSVFIGGSLVGGSGGASGVILATGDVGSIRIGHDFVGGSLRQGETVDLLQSGFIASGGRIVSVQIGGSIIAGLDLSAAASIVDSATIRAQADIGSLTVKGGIIGNSSPVGNSLVVISGQGQAAPRGSVDLAIGKVSVGGRVEFGQILAGYDALLAPGNADAQIGTVSVRGDWIASSIVAGAVNLGFDDAPGGAGADADNVRFGDSHDAKITGGTDDPNRISRIGKITIGGQVFGTPVSFSDDDRYGFVAEQIGALKIAGGVVALESGAGDDGHILGPTRDITLHEIDAAFLVSPAPTASAKLINATTVTYEDVDGDRVTVKFSKPLLVAGDVNDVLRFDTGTIGDGVPARQQLQLIDLTRLPGAEGLSITITVAPGGGDRAVNVGAILANVDLGTITIAGDLGQIAAGDADTTTPGLAALKVRSMGRMGLDTQPEADGTFIPFSGGDILGSLGSLEVKQDFAGASLAIGGAIGKVTIGGSMIGGNTLNGGTIGASQSIGPVKIGAHIEAGSSGNSSFIDAGTSIASAKIGGSIIGGIINADGSTLGDVKVAHNVMGGLTSATGRISANLGVGKVTIGGSLLGGRGDLSGQIFGAAGGVGALKIGHNIVGGVGDESGKIDSAGGIASLAVAGSLIGREGEYNTFSPGGVTHRAQVFALEDIGKVAIGHDMLGGTGVAAGAISGANIAAVSVRGSVVGGAENDSARLRADDRLGIVKISRDLLGNAGQNSGSVSGETIDGVTIGGSILGGTANAAGQINGDSSLGAVKIGHDVHGGSAPVTGYIVSDGTITSVTIGGSLIGGTANLTGGIFPTELGPVKIGRDLVGGSLVAGAATFNRSGFIEAQSRIASVTVGGSIIAGIDDSAVGALLSNGSIRTGADLGALTVKGSLIGNISLQGTSLVIISARGQAAPAGGTDLAFGKITIGGRVERANILAGYGQSLDPLNDDAQIGAVKVGHDWIASNLVAGTVAGADGFFGTEDDALITGDDPLSRIASIFVKGTVFGTGAVGDHFGFVAHEIGAAKFGGQTLALVPSATDLAFPLSPVTGDVRLLEL